MFTSEVFINTVFNNESVMKVLENLYGTNNRVRIFYGNVDGLWHEEHDVCGRIGRSTGTHKIPLLCHNSRSVGGEVLPYNLIVGIMNNKKKWLFKTDNLEELLKGYAAMEFKKNDYPFDPEYTFACGYNGESLAVFKNEKQRDAYINFMSGKTLRK